MGRHAARHNGELVAAKAQIPELVQQGLSGREIAERIGVSASTARKWVRMHRAGNDKAPKMASRKAKSVARQLYTIGKSYTDISNHLGVDREVIKEWCRTRNISRKYLGYHVCMRHDPYPHGFFEGLAARGWGYA